MFFSHTLRYSRAVSASFFQLAANRHFRPQALAPCVALGILERHTTLGFGQHRIVSFSPQFMGQHGSHGQIIACQPAR